MQFIVILFIIVLVIAIEQPDYPLLYVNLGCLFPMLASVIGAYYAVRHERPGMFLFLNIIMPLSYSMPIANIILGERSFLLSWVLGCSGFGSFLLNPLS